MYRFMKVKQNYFTEFYYNAKCSIAIIMKAKSVILFFMCTFSILSYSQNNVAKSDTILNEVNRDNILISYPRFNDKEIQLKIDNNNSLVFSKIVDNLNLTKDEIYVKAFSFFTYNYRDAKSVIQQQDKDAGIIMGKGFFSDFSYFTKSRNIGMGITNTTTDKYGAYHFLRIDIKEGKARIVLIVDNYEIDRILSSSQSMGSALLSGNSALVIPNNNLTIIPKLIVNCTPINSKSISERTTETLLEHGIKKPNKAIMKTYVESVTFDYESEANAFSDLLNKAISTILSFEKSLVLDSLSKETDGW